MHACPKPSPAPSWQLAMPNCQWHAREAGKASSRPYPPSLLSTTTSRTECFASLNNSPIHSQLHDHTMHVLSEDSPANGLCLLWCGGIGFDDEA